jgi:hypothetical protein
MKKPILSLAFISLLMWGTTAYATFVSGSTGALGAFNPSVNTVVTLPPDGVLNYTTINIPAGVTVTFQKNAANTPAYMLATGDVVLAGAIRLDGGNATLTDTGKGGPGGFDGGNGGPTNSPGGKGLGPGGGNPGRLNDGGGGGGGFGSSGYNGGNGGGGAGGAAYGNVRLLPLLGGSGGGGGSLYNLPSGPGGGGGGAIAIASSTSITFTGVITANGGNTYSSGVRGGGGGSGGAIKLVANVISGNGTLTATNGGGGNGGADGGTGRIRIEATTNNRTANTNPAYTYGAPSSIFVANIPMLTITSIANTTVPGNPTGNYNQPDMLLNSSTTNPVAVNISATNIPDGTTVTVWVLPQYGNPSSVNTILSGSAASANVTLSTTYSNIITAQATFTVVGIYYNGEEIDKVRVAAILGGKSEITYITKSGKEINGELVAALMK